MVALGALLMLSSTFAGLEAEPADVAPSAYSYRADRRLSANPPESYLALMRCAGQPLNQRLDPSAPAVQSALCSLLWEENRPITHMVLHWPSDRKQPPAHDLEAFALVPTSSANSWWNNLAAQPLATPSVSDGGRTLTYEVARNTCGLVVRLVHGSAAGVAVPAVQAFEPFRWKPMSLEIEWGFQPGTEDKDFSGQIDAYDGRIANLAPLSSDDPTDASHDRWRSPARSRGRRGVRLDVLYLGKTTWRRVLPWTTQPGEVARSILTVRTRSGSFSFNPADLEHGPIYAPEYGFFVRRTSSVRPEAPPSPFPGLFTDRMDAVVGSAELKGWGSAATPLFCANPASHAVESRGIRMPPDSVAMHPGERESVFVSWRSPVDGLCVPRVSLEHEQAGGIGVGWKLRVEAPDGRETIVGGTTDGKPGRPFSASPGPQRMKRGDRLTLVVSNLGDYRSCTVGIDFLVVSGNRTWSLAQDVSGSLLSSNPHADRFGEPGVWSFGSELPWEEAASNTPPIDQESRAETGAQYTAELQRRGIKTLREMTDEAPEMTWDAAVHATRGDDLPPIPEPPPEALPKMRIDVPDARLQAQWNLGAWHLTRHCAVNPKTGKLWFNDFPYGVLAAETYLVLTVLDQMGEHQAAQDGFDQWTMLPMERDHPVGLFSDGRGALTFATGPKGYGGDMDGIHAFGPGSIGWALAQHFWLTGDVGWLRQNAARLKANADWMLRQRELNRSNLPGGERLWCAGLQPALQVTPDSGGLWMQFYEAEGYYCSSIGELAEALKQIGDPDAGRLAREAASYRRDLRAAVDRSITLSPVVAVRDGTYRSVIPFACYCRGAATGAWGWMRDGSGQHVGPMYWDTVQNAASLVWPAGILSPSDPRVQGYLDVLEDRFLMENPYAQGRSWFFRGWQYQGGLERTANLNLVSGDPKTFLRTFLNDYAVDVLPKDGYVFNEHAVHGPPDKIFEEAAFLERFRDMLAMEDGDTLWIARAIPADWLAAGRHVSVEGAPTRFGDLGYRLSADAQTVRASISVPSRRAPREMFVRLRVPGGRRIRSVTVNGRPWKDFDARTSTVRLRRLSGRVEVLANYL